MGTFLRAGLTYLVPPTARNEAGIRHFLAEHPEKFDQRDYAGAARDAIAREIAARMRAFGTAGRAPEVKPLGLEEMKARYAGGW